MQTTIAVSHQTVTGVPSNKLGTWLFLASEVMFFTGLIAAYIVLRISNPAWPGAEGHLSVPIGTGNTLILICSSMTVVMALNASERRQYGALRAWLLATILLGSLFLGIKGYEYSLKFAHHLYPSTNIFWSCYFTLTGFHGVHVLGGVLFNLWVWMRTFDPSSWPRRSHLLELGGLYWHFVDIVWIFLFPLLYLL